jgi:hypothetical protein
MRPQKIITFGDMRDMGVRGVLVYCADYHCSHSVALSADRWPDEMRLSDVEPRFTRSACGGRGADSGPTSIGGSRLSRRWDIGEVLRERVKRKTASVHDI